MTDEDAFLAALAENPADDVRRLVYADWLEERGEAEKATYLRLVCRAAEALGTPAESAIIDPLLKLADALPRGWRTQSAAKFGLVLKKTGPPITEVFFNLQFLFAWGADESLTAVTNAPTQLFSLAPLEDIVCARALLGDAAVHHFTITADPADQVQRLLPMPTVTRKYFLRAVFGVTRFPPPPASGTTAEQALADVTAFLTTHGSSPPERLLTLNVEENSFPLQDQVPITKAARLLPVIREEGRRIARDHSWFFFVNIKPAPSS